MRLTFMILLIGYFCQNCWAREKPVVSTPSGHVKGSILTSRLGKNIYAFRGIRYAQAPVGELRFKPPVPVNSWEGVYDATEDGYMCPQPRPSFEIGNMSEDCLILNIYSTKLPNKNSNPKRPVIIHLNPGGFYSEGSVSYWNGPQYLTDQDVVYVTYSSRVGTLGYISTGDNLAPGNNGLKDQIVMLKWVKKHIKSFGGDPDNITVMGDSAGAWSIIVYMVSPLTRGLGLFHKAILMSGGGPLSIFPMPKNQFELAQKQARLMKCPDDTSENILNCLKKVDALEMAQSFYQLQEFGYDPILIWSPVIDGEVITDHPIKLFMQKKFDPIPVMIGQTADETGARAFTVIRNGTLLDEMNKNFNEIAPIAFIYERNTSQSVKVSEAIKRFYFHGKEIDDSQFDNLANVYSDSIIGFGVHRATKLLAQYSTQLVYSYCFTFQGRYSHFYYPGINSTIPWGVVHHDDLIYLMFIRGYNDVGFPFFGKDSPQPEASMVDKLTRIHYNFAKTGNPTPQQVSLLNNVTWAPYTLKNEEYLDIGDKLVMKQKLYEERFKFWEKLYPLDMYKQT